MAAPLEELDADAIKTGLAQYQAAYEKARRAPGLSRGPSRNLRGAASELSRNRRSRLGTFRDPPETLPSPSDIRPRPARDPPEAFPQATDDMVKSEAEIGVEVYQAMSYAISEA